MNSVSQAELADRIADGNGPIDLSGRLDAIPASRGLWMLVAVLSMGAFCEIFSLSLSSMLVPGLVRSGLFRSDGVSLFGLNSTATFIGSTFLGLWIGTLAFSGASDRWGRLPVLRYSLVCYTVTTVLMGLQHTALGIDLMRIATGLGMGVQGIAIDCFVAEVVPRTLRGRAFAINTAIQFSATPVAAVCALLLVPHSAWGIDGWRWLCFSTLPLAVIVLYIQRRQFESPRWLTQVGRHAEAAHIVAGIEAKCGVVGSSLIMNRPAAAHAPAIERELSTRDYRRRLAMMAAANFLQAIGYYGFMNWVPSLLAAKGADLAHSLGYSAAILLSFPLAPLAFVFFADRFERKHQFVTGAICAGVFGLIFARQTTPLGWLVLGVLVTISSNLMAFALHAYQSEIFSTAKRSKAVGFVYSFTRLATIFSGYIVAYSLKQVGVSGVFGILDGALLCTALTVLVFGPRTRGLTLEQIASSKATSAQ